MTLGEFIRRRRVLLGLTQEQMVERLGRTASWLSRIETDNRREPLSTEDVASLANALECSQADILQAAGYDVGLPERPDRGRIGDTWLTDDEERLLQEILLAVRRQQRDTDN